MTQANQPLDNGDPNPPPPEQHPMEQSKKMSVWLAVVMMAAIAIGGIVIGNMMAPSGAASPSTSASTSASAAPVEKTEDASKKTEEAVKAKEEPEAKTEEAVPAEFQRRCRDDAVIADCRSTSVEELEKCGLCVNGKCSQPPSPVQLKCNAAIINYAAVVMASGQGTVNMCPCQSVQAPSASE